jgi:predicted transcriptional regulator of viral defense system
MVQNEGKTRKFAFKKNQGNMKKLIKIFEKNKGFARMSELKDSGIHTRTVAQAVENGIIQKLKPGLYKLVNYSFDENESFVSVYNANRSAVICLLSAASHYELTTYDPSEIYIAVPHHRKRFPLEYPPVKIFYFTDKYYKPGINIIKTVSGEIKIYSREKTIIDLFRYKDKLGEDIALESLKTYMRFKDKKVNVLGDMAYKLGAYKKMEPFIKAAL